MVQDNESKTNTKSDVQQRERQDLEQKARDGTITDQERTRLADMQRASTYGAQSTSS